jgi:hypothetical protein
MGLLEAVAELEAKRFAREEQDNLDKTFDK